MGIPTRTLRVRHGYALGYRWVSQGKRMFLSKKQLSFFVIFLALFVFLLALNAKLSLYEQPLHPNATNSSKMWLNGQKMEAEVRTVLVFATFSRPTPKSGTRTRDTLTCRRCLS